MKITPRWYQTEAHNAVVEHWKRSTLPVVVEAETASGKSVIIALLAKTLHHLSVGKRVLCLAPSAELVVQNAEKYKAIGEKASIYSASVKKSLRNQVVFATPLTFKKVARRLGSEFAGVIIDECHRIAPTEQAIIEDMKIGNPYLRVCGLSGTPYRALGGFVFRVDPDGKALPESIARDPYFHQCVYSIGARLLLEQGFITPLRAGDINVSKYDTSGLKVQSNGQYSAATIKAAFEGWGRKTSSIVADVVAQTQDATGVMIFAATVQHAKEVMASLHPDNARLITGTTKKSDREKYIADFKERKYLYLVSVGAVTTGFDAPNVSHIAILRATESVSLLKQIFGRAMRLYPGKKEAVILDYAGNIEKHMPSGDLYAPQIKAAYKSADATFLECECPSCNGINTFSCRKNELGLEWDVNGYFVDLDGRQVTTTDLYGEQQPLPAHYGRRCVHVDRFGNRCDYYWTSKQCLVCDHHNDIAARYCEKCKTEIIDPNSKLIDVYKMQKKDPSKLQAEEVLSMEHTFGISRAGNEMVTLEFLTPQRRFKVYVRKSTPQYVWLNDVTNNLTVKPRTVSYLKDGDFWVLKSFNQPTDGERLKSELIERGYKDEIPELA